MKKALLVSLLLSFFSRVNAAVPVDPLLEELLKRNGDVYLLIADSAVGDLYMFDRSENYQRSDVIPPASPLYSRLPNYVGFSVDKFGHIKLFRAKQDIDSPNGATSILDATLLARRHPDENLSLPNPMTKNNSMNLPGETPVAGIPAGWRYVISANGKEGYKKVYESSGGPDSMGEGVSADMNAISGYFKLRPIPGAISPGDVILPPEYKTYPRAFYLGYHGGFWQAGRNSFAVEHEDARAFTSFSTDFSCCGGTSYSPDPIADWGCYQLPYEAGDPNKDWVLYDQGPGNAGSSPLSPPVGAFFMVPHCMGGSYTQYGKLRAAAMVKDVRKNVKVLLVDSFLSGYDNQVMIDNAPNSASFNTLRDGRDFFSSAGANGYSDGTDNPLASTVSYASDIGRWNNCGDLCGLGSIDASQVPPPSPSSTAYASSYGKDQSEQRLYMIKIASLGGGNIQTSVVQIQVSEGGNQQAELVTPELAAVSGVKGYVLGEKDNDFRSSLTQQVVYRALDSDLGYAGNQDVPEFVQSLGFSKRRDGTTDYVYYSNLPSSHFTVSSNFWGTGGTVWFAEESNNRLLLKYQNYNHSDANALSQGSIDAGDRLPLKAIAADGDNNVYIVHSKDTLEGPESMKRLFGNRMDRNSIKLLCEKGLVEEMLDPTGAVMNCNSLDTGVAVASLNGVAQIPVELQITLKQHAGFVVEKLSPIAGSRPEKLGVIPTVRVGTCSTTAQFPMDAPGDMIFNADNAAIGDSGWNCTMNPAGFSSPDLGGIAVKLGVINVPNPPASGSSTNVDIVNPCDTSPVSGTCDGLGNLQEDTVAIFRMENPPHYAGLPAVLSQSSDPVLKQLGVAAGGAVKMVSNYLSTGWDYTKTLGLSSGMGTVEDLYWDRDSSIGVTLATLLNEPYIPEASDVMNSRMGTGQNADRTMRYRWIVRAQSPPHSLVDYSVNDMPYRPTFTDFSAPVPRVAPGCENIRGNGFYQWPELENPAGTQLRGLLFDSCWQDMKRVVAGSLETPVYAPEDLNYNFLDPGKYQVTLMVGALGFDLTDITYLSDPASVASTMIVTYSHMLIHVGAEAPASNPYLTDIEVNAVDLTSDVDLSVSDLYAASLNSDELNDGFAKELRGGMASGELGALPLFSNRYEEATDLIMTQENVPVPLHTEGQIQFFRSRNINYLEGPEEIRQSKVDGAGIWDFQFSCPRSVFNTGAGVYDSPSSRNCGVIGGVPLVDKSGTHPSNWSRTTTGLVELSQEFGNDASADITNRRSARTVADDGVVILSTDFQVLHQGTLAQDRSYPDGGNLVSSPYAFYTWYDYKYVWFARYIKPDGELKEIVIRTGNLAEVWLLNYLANYSADKEKYQKLLDMVAPDSLNSSSDAPNEKSLIRVLDAEQRKFSFKIPLLQNNSLLSGGVLNEMNGILNEELDQDSEFSSTSLYELAKKIRPLRFPIPTGATVIELGCQVFGPAVAWKGQEEILNSADVGTGTYSYYDVAPALVSADGQLISTDRDFSRLIREYEFGDDRFSTWQAFGTPRNQYAPHPVLPFGLNQDETVPGFTVNSSGSASYNGNQDHFVEIWVGDLQNPELTVSSNTDLSLIAGRANLEAPRLTFRDNNPYGAWLNRSGTSRQDGLPMLTQFYFELGADVRNYRRIGLLEGQSYGFGVSNRALNLEEVPDLASMRKNANLAMLWPGKPSPGIGLQSVANHFVYYDSGEGRIRGNDRFFHNNAWPDSLTDVFSENDPSRWWVNRKASEETVFFYPDEEGPEARADGSFPLTGHRAEQTLDRPGAVLMLVGHMRDGDTNLFGFPEDSDEARPHIIRTGEDAMLDCLDGVHPHKADPSLCYLETSWEVEASSIVAPWFYNRDYGLEWSIYAVAQDARLMADYPGLNLGIASTGFHYRLAGKTNAENSLGDIRAGSIGNMRKNAWKGMNEPMAGKIGTIRWTDQTPPALKVSLMDFKSRQAVHYAALPDSGLNRSGVTGLLSHEERWHILRSVDPRDATDETGNWFQAQAIERLAEPVTGMGSGPVRVEIAPAEFASAATVEQVFYQVPEDTRFEVKAVMSDNATGQVLDGRILIESAACAPTAMNLAAMGIPVTQAPFPSTGDTGAREYQDMGELRAWHFYPRSGYMDSIRVTATDRNGNQTALCIPVQIIPQAVHFRKIGSDQEIR